MPRERVVEECRPLPSEEGTTKKVSALLTLKFEARICPGLSDKCLARSTPDGSGAAPALAHIYGVYTACMANVRCAEARIYAALGVYDTGVGQHPRWPRRTRVTLSPFASLFALSTDVRHTHDVY